MHFKKEYTTLYVVISILLIVLILFGLLQFEYNPAIVITIFWGILLITLITLGNKLISSFLDKRLPWSMFLSVRFFVQLVSILIYSLLCFNISYFIFKMMFTNDPPPPRQSPSPTR